MLFRMSTKGMLTTAAETTAGDVGRLDVARKRLLADWCRLVGDRLAGRDVPSTPVPPAAMPGQPSTNSVDKSSKPDPLAGVSISPRMRDILDCLLTGDSEKQIAGKLHISPHTVHTYVKRLHKTLGVSSRGELLAKFVAK